ncbi:FUSC family protein [Microcoleus sp. Pol11C3]|uniref:FUSC family protein n=1 Tax=Microcoleus sp. Pol11C3 TaxID=3055390 RepID=UPI002FD487BD
MRHIQLQQAWLNLKSLPWDNAVRYMLSIGIPLITGSATGLLRYGVVAVIGSMYVVSIANVDAPPKDRLLSTLVGSVLITGCAQLGSFLTDSPELIALGVLVLGTTAGWLHSTHMAIEIMVRFAVLGFLFGALQLAAFGTQLIAIDERVIFIFLAGGLWTSIIIALEHWLFRVNRLTAGAAVSEGWQRIQSNQTAGLRFALCYGIVATSAVGGSFLLHLPRPFWVAATTLLVMKPDSRATVQRTSQRIVGTLIGVLLVEAMITSTNSPNLLIAYILLAAPLIPIGLAKNYTLCCAAVTVLVMVMIDLLMLNQGGDRALLPVRFYATLVGCVLTALGTAITYPELWLHKKERDS